MGTMPEVDVVSPLGWNDAFVAGYAVRLLEGDVAGRVPALRAWLWHGQSGPLWRRSASVGRRRAVRPGRWNWRRYKLRRGGR